MTVSGTISTTNFDVIRVIDTAYRRCKIPAQRITPEMQDIARDALYLLLSTAPVKGVQLWAIDSQTITPLLNTAAHPAPAGTIDIISAYKRTAGQDIMLTRVAQDSYDNLPNKLSAGRPSQFWLDRQRDVPVLMLWPVPDAAFVAASTIVIRRKRHLMDVGSMTQTLDIPQRWHDAVIAELAKRLAMETPQVDGQVAMMLEAQAERAWKLAQNAEEDSSPMRILPDISAYTRRGR